MVEPGESATKAAVLRVAQMQLAVSFHIAQSTATKVGTRGQTPVSGHL